jgi:osmoprotectant transport system substrate-binding protein
MKTFRFAVILLLAFWIGAAPTACSVREGEKVRIGSKDFTEQLILAELYALALEDAGTPVERRFNLGGTPVAHAALTAGEIDVYPEYTGTAYVTVLKMSASTDPKAVFDAVAREYATKFRLTWLDRAPMDNAQAIAMTRAGAERLGVRTISDLAAKASEVTLVGPPEFTEREDGLLGLRKFYGGFALKRFIAVDAGLRYAALLGGNADAAVAFGTDGEIAAHELIILEDDKKMFPPYQVAPVVRRDVIEARPRLRETLNRVSATLDNATMRELNFAVSGKKLEPSAVAREFLIRRGLISAKP